MKLQRYFCLLLFCLPLLVYAQSDKTVTVSYERSSEGEIYDAVIHYGKTRLLTLRPSTENVPIGFSYRYTYKKGNSRLKTDTSFVYLFPLAQGKVVRVNKMVSLDNFIGKEGEKRITGLGFSTTAGEPLGIIGGENYKQGSHLRFSIYCPDRPDHSYVPDFYLSPEETGKPEERVMYKSWHPVEIIMKEMSKKEKKKFLSKE